MMSGSRRVIAALALAFTVAAIGTRSVGAEGVLRMWLEGTPEVPNAPDVLREALADIGNEPKLQIETSAERGAASGFKRALRSGTADAAEIPLSALTRDSALFAADQIPGLAAGPDGPRRLYGTLGVLLARRLSGGGIVLVALLPRAPVGILAARRLERAADLAGARIWAPTAAKRRVAELLGEVAGAGKGVRVVAKSEDADLLMVSADAAIDVLAERTAAGGTRTADWTFYTLDGWRPARAVIVPRAVMTKLGGGFETRLAELGRAAAGRWWAASADHTRKSERRLAEAGAAVEALVPELAGTLTQIGRRMADEWAPGAGADGAELLDALGLVRGSR